jgi:hypothetical protein
MLERAYLIAAVYWAMRHPSWGAPNVIQDCILLKCMRTLRAGEWFLELLEREGASCANCGPVHDNVIVIIKSSSLGVCDTKFWHPRL